MLDEFLGGAGTAFLDSQQRGLILFRRSERAKSDPRSIDTLSVSFPAILLPKNADASGVQKQPFTSREKY